jgi:symplekin
LETALEVSVSADDDARTRAIRMVVSKIHPAPAFAEAVERFAEYHLSEAADAGVRALTEARATAAKASEALMKAKAKRRAAEKRRAERAVQAKAEAEGVRLEEETPIAEDETSASRAEALELSQRVESAAVRVAVAHVARRVSLFCALCHRRNGFLPRLFATFAAFPEALRPALVDGASSFDGLVRSVGANCAALLATISNPPPGSESLAARAIRVLAAARREEEARAQDAPEGKTSQTSQTLRTLDPGSDGSRGSDPPEATRSDVSGLVLAAESFVAALATRGVSTDPGAFPESDSATAMDDGVRALIPVLPWMSAEKVRGLMPRLVNLPEADFKDALDRLCGLRIRSGWDDRDDRDDRDAPIARPGIAEEPYGTPQPLSASEIMEALHAVDPARHGVALKKIIRACGECFERPAVFTKEALAGALSRMVEMNPLPLLFMRTVIQAETASPGLREFTLGVLRTLTRRKVWKMDGKIWEGFVRCAKRSAPRSFPVLCELPEQPLLEVLRKFPTLTEPLRAYVNAPAVAGTVPRPVRDALLKAP